MLCIHYFKERHNYLFGLEKTFHGFNLSKEVPCTVEYVCQKESTSILQ